MATHIFPVQSDKLGKITARPRPEDFLDELQIDLDPSSTDAQQLLNAAQQLRTSDIPVAFPTETVYGLGADATRSNAVKGIYKAKQRPSDNPLIIHFASLNQLRSLLDSSLARPAAGETAPDGFQSDPIPAIYRPLISWFWPGPLTIILPNPNDSTLAPEVTAGLRTFGARIPRHVLALALIQLAGVPVAAPSANASTKPSPTTAEHVAYDLGGRIETILDGGPCDVGVESTVVDGLCQPPLILRPGGISIEQIRACPGWEDTQIGYKNTSEQGSKPKAPGMKYRHYSPKATVILYEAGKPPPTLDEMSKWSNNSPKVGIIRTRSWTLDISHPSRVLCSAMAHTSQTNGRMSSLGNNDVTPGFAGMLQTIHDANRRISTLELYEIVHDRATIQLLDIGLGSELGDIARGIFSALRDLDRQDVTVIFVEGVDDLEGEIAAAVMNRLRKAAEIKITVEV